MCDIELDGEEKVDEFGEGNGSWRRGEDITIVGETPAMVAAVVVVVGVVGVESVDIMLALVEFCVSFVGLLETGINSCDKGDIDGVICLSTEADEEEDRCLDLESESF